MTLISIMAGLFLLGLIIAGIITYKYFAWDKKTRVYYCTESTCRKGIDCVHAKNNVLRNMMGANFNGKKLKVDFRDVIQNCCPKFKDISEVK